MSRRPTSIVCMVLWAIFLERLSFLARVLGLGELLGFQPIGVTKQKYSVPEGLIYKVFSWIPTHPLPLGQ